MRAISTGAHSVLAEKAVGFVAGIAADAAQDTAKAAGKKIFEDRNESS